MNSNELKQRTKFFAISIIRFIRSLPKDQISDILNRQIIRSATSVAANYRAACRGKSTADFLNKINIVEEEADETHFWLEVFQEANVHSSPTLLALLDEANQLTAIFTAIGRSIKSRPS